MKLIYEVAAAYRTEPTMARAWVEAGQEPGWLKTRKAMIEMGVSGG